MGGTNPTTMSERLLDSSLPLGRKLDMMNTKLLYQVLKLHSRKSIGQNIGYLLLCCHVLDLHYSSLHHIPDIVELDLNVLRLVMEYWVFRQLHATLIVREDASHIQLEIK